jgi:hypothetical protein
MTLIERFAHRFCEILAKRADFDEEERLPNGWVSCFDPIAGVEYFTCPETEDTAFSREDLFRKKFAANSVSSWRSVSL